MQWCLTQELKSHSNKRKPVYLIADEASNFKLPDLGELLTYARGYGLRTHLFLQNFAAFIKTYSRETLSILQSETEVQQFLPGIREPETLQYVERKAGWPRPL